MKYVINIHVYHAKLPCYSRSTYWNTNCISIDILMVLSATFNNISVMSWWLVLLVDETRGHGEKHRPAATLSTKSSGRNCSVIFRYKSIGHV